MVERAVYRCEGEVIGRIEFNPFAFSAPDRYPSTYLHSRGVEKPASSGSDVSVSRSPVDLSIPLKDAVYSLKREYLLLALEKSHHNQRRAAALLGLTYHQFRALYRSLKEEIT